MDKQSYINQQIILQNRLSRKWSVPLFKALSTQVNAAIKVVSEMGEQAALRYVNNNLYINEQVAMVIKGLYADAYKLATPRTHINKASPILQSALSYLDDHLLEKVVLPISQTSRNDIARILETSISEGWGVQKTVNRLKLDGIPKWRVKLIIRTESVRALNFSQIKAASDDRYEIEKTWIAIRDERTRDHHQDLDGIRINLWDEFPYGLLYPGDPNAPASETCNCRCTLGYRVKRDAQGKPVRNEGYFEQQLATA